MNGPINAQFSANLARWQRVSLLLELEARCLNGQFSMSCYESCDRHLTRECEEMTATAQA